MANFFGQFTPASSDTNILTAKLHVIAAQERHEKSPKKDIYSSQMWLLGGDSSYGSLKPSLMIPPIHTTGGHSPTIFVSSVQSWSFLLLILDNVSMAAGDGLS